MLKCFQPTTRHSYLTWSEFGFIVTTAVEKQSALVSTVCTITPTTVFLFSLSAGSAERLLLKAHIFIIYAF